MSILDAVTGLAGGQGAAGGNSTLELIAGLVQKSGGIGGLISALQQGGLGGLVESWIGTGASQPVTGQQLGQALGGTAAGQHVEQMAQANGVSSSQVFDQLAQHLPAVVDHLTPDGQVPSGGSGFDLGQLAGLAGKLGL